MKIKSGELVKSMRKEMGLSQEDMAAKLHVSTRQFSRIETDEADLDVWQFVSFFELLGRPTEDIWLLYLDSGEYDEYQAYRNVKRLMWAKRIPEAKEALQKLEEMGLSKRPMIGQFITYAKASTNKDAPPEQILEELKAAIHMSIPKFDEGTIAEYRLTYNEVNILCLMATNLRKLGETERAISINEAIIKNRENIRASEEDKAKLLPAIMFNMSNLLGQSGKHKEALKYCNTALDISREYNNLLSVPGILYNTACSLKLLGEEERVYKPHLQRAYHCAYAIGDTENANIIKNDAEKYFGITAL